MADTQHVLRLAAIIREVDGNHSKGAAALAELILDHSGFRAALADEPPEPIPPAALPEGYIDPEHSGDDRALLQTFYSACQAEGGTADEVTLQGLRAVLARWHLGLPVSDEPAVPQGREPASVTGQPSDQEIIAFWFDYCAGDVVRFARAVLARWGNPAPRPLANGTEEQVWPLSVADGCHEAAISAVTGSPEQQLLANAGNTIDNLWNELEREGWALSRLHRLHQENARFREPERTILCDILANGTLLPDPDGKRYGVQPVDGEVAELVTWLQEIGETIKPRHLAEHQRYKRAAELLQRLSPPQPVPVGERPWEREEWCDTDGLCWLGSHALDGCTPTWLFGPPAWAERFPTVHRVVLPAHALPLPEVGE